VPDLRVDIETASRDELVAEVLRLDAVCNRWAESWHTIVGANAEAWGEMVIELKDRVAMLEGLL